MVLTGNENISEASFEELQQMQDEIRKAVIRDGEISDFWRNRYTKIKNELYGRIYGKNK